MKTGVNCTKNCKLYKKSYGYNTELFLIRKIWTTLGEEDHFSNIADMQPPHLPFTYVFIGLGSGTRKSVGVRTK